MVRILVLSIVMATGCATVKPGHEGVVYTKPLIFGHGGVEEETVKPGLTWIALTTEVIEVAVMPVQFDEAFDDLMCKRSVPLDFHAVARLRVTQPATLIKVFGNDWYKANVQRQFQNFIRDHAKEYTMEELSVEQTKVREFEQNVERDTRAYLKQISLPVELLDVTVGKVSPPKEVMDRFAATAAETQRQNTERQRKLAEDARAEAEGARAIADKAYMDKMGMSPVSWVQLESIRLCTSKAGCQVFLGSSPVPIVGR